MTHSLRSSMQSIQAPTRMSDIKSYLNMPEQVMRNGRMVSIKETNERKWAH